MLLKITIVIMKNINLITNFVLESLSIFRGLFFKNYLLKISHIPNKILAKIVLPQYEILH